MAANPGGSSRPRDDQQAKLVERLRAAGGAPVDFDELRAIGVEHPAVVSYELEAAGVPIVQTRASNRRALAIDERLDGTDGAERARGGEAAGPAMRATGAPAGHPVAPELRGRAGGRLRVLLARPSDAGSVAVWLQGAARSFARASTTRRAALTATPILAIVLTVGIASLLFDDPGRARAVHNAAHAGTAGYRPAGMGGRRAPRVAAAAVGGGTAPSARPVASAVAGALGPSSPAVAGALDLEGHRLLSDGRYAAAIGDLTGAIRASGQSLAGCMQPTSESCLTFADALYDLGRALRLEGESGAAVQILSERLRIDNQRPVVQHELDLARGAGA
jgi:hypothetical protein